MRERDAKISELVFGRCPVLLEGANEWMEFANEHDYQGGKEGWILPAYTTDLAADYSVLVRVREMWTGVDLDSFRNQLEAIWVLRIDSDMGDPCRYEPGDYSTAALAALAGKEKAS